MLISLFLIQGNISCFDILIVFILTVLGYKTVKFFDYYTQTVVTSSFTDCDILDKTNCLTLHGSLRIDAEVTIKITSNTRTRSRYSRFVYYKYSRIRSQSTRDRAPSRLPVQTLNRLKTKSKLLRRVVYNFTVILPFYPLFFIHFDN